MAREDVVRAAAQALLDHRPGMPGRLRLMDDLSRVFPDARIPAAMDVIRAARAYRDVSDHVRWIELDDALARWDETEERQEG